MEVSNISEYKERVPHTVPFLVSSELNARHNIYLEPEDIYADDVKCLRPRLTPKQKAWLFRSIDKKVRSVSTLPALSKRHGGAEGVTSLHCFHTVAVSSHVKFRCSAEKVGSSHSFHTLVPNMNLVKPVTSQLSHACEKPEAWFPRFLRSQARPMIRYNIVFNLGDRQTERKCETTIMSSIEFSPFINEAVFLVPESGKREAEFPSFKALKRMKGELCLGDHLRLAFVWDDKDEFINAFKGVPPDEDLPVSLFGFMYAYDAVNCASQLIYHNHNHAHFPFNIFDTAVGKVKYRDRELYVVSTVSTPLHTAAVSQSINLIRLFLDAGLSPNVRIDYIHTWKIPSNATDVSPLDLAITHFWERYGMKDWAKTKPIFELIVNVCSPWMAKQIELVRLLARKTSDLGQQFFKYMEDGKVAEMCLLLLAGCKPPSIDLLECRDDIPEKEKILELFEVFNTIGDKLSGYIRIPRSKYAMLDRVTSEITAIFEDSGLVVKCKDIPYKRPVEYDLLPVPDSKKIIIPRLLSPPALRGLSFTNKESPSVHGVRGFHKSSFPEAGRNLSRVQVKNNKVTGDLRFQFYKHRAFFTTALKRMGRLV